MEFEVKEISFEDSAMGKQTQELQKLRDEFDQYRSEQTANHAAVEHRVKIAGILGFFFGIVGSVIAGLIVYYWPVIISLFH